MAILTYSASGRVVRHHVLILLTLIMNCSADSSGFCLNQSKSAIETPTFDLTKWDWNFSSISSHELIEFVGSEAYQVNACRVKELGNNLCFPFPLLEYSPHWMVNHDICSKAVLSSSPKNIVKSDALNPLGHSSLSILSGYGFL
jgi:hypothetical protein